MILCLYISLHNVEIIFRYRIPLGTVTVQELVDHWQVKTLEAVTQDKNLDTGDLLPGITCILTEERPEGKNNHKGMPLW